MRGDLHICLDAVLCTAHQRTHQAVVSGMSLDELNEAHPAAFSSARLIPDTTGLPVELQSSEQLVVPIPAAAE